MTYLRYILLFIMMIPNLYALPQSSWYHQDGEGKLILDVQLFTVSTCPHCQKEEAFFKTILETNPWINLHQHVIDKNKQDLLLFGNYLQQLKIHDFSVPALFFCDSRWVGFSPIRNSGPRLLEGLQFCYQAIQKENTLNHATIQALRQRATSYWLNDGIDVKAKNSYLLPLLPAMAILSFCSFVSIFLLFSLLYLNKQKPLPILFAFLFSAVVVQFLQQYYDAFFWSLLDNLLIPASLIGLLGAGYVILLTKKSDKALKVAMLATVLLAFSVQMYQQTCSPNFSSIYHQQLREMSLSPTSQWYFYLAYDLIYIVCLALVSGILFLYSKSKRMQNAAVGLRFFCAAVILITSISLIIYPLWFGAIWFNVILIVTLAIIAWGVNRRVS